MYVLTFHPGIPAAVVDREIPASKKKNKEGAPDVDMGEEEDWDIGFYCYVSRLKHISTHAVR